MFRTHLGALIGALVLAGPLLATAAPQDPVIGRIGARDLHLSRVLERDHAELAVLGRSVAEDQFRQRARVIIQSNVQAALVEELMFQDAEREMGARLDVERKRFMADRRRQLADEHGSERAADRFLRDETDRGLEETLVEQWEGAAMQWRLTKLLAGRLSISDEDVARVYERRGDTYRTPAKLRLRMITARDEAAANRIDLALAAGTPFATIATGAHNVRDGSVITMTDSDLVEPLATAARGLEPGEHSHRVVAGGRNHWIQVVGVEPSQEITLAEARPQIERELRSKRQVEIQNAYIEELLRTWEHTPREQMTRVALQAAIKRYAGGA